MEFQHELIIPNEGLPFKVFLFEGGNGNYVREKHWHTSVEIFAVMEGRLDFFVNKDEYPLKAGEQIIINSNEIHSIHAVEKNKTVVLQIPLKQFENYFTAQRYIRFRGQEELVDKKLASLLRKLYHVYSERKIGYEFRTISIFYEIMYILVKDYRVTETREKDIRHSRRLDALSKITTYMREHYREELKLSDVAATFGYSDAYLSRMFQKYAGINYKDYLQAIRTEHGYRQLIETKMTISDISMENGFPNNKAFSKAFYKKYGIMPAEFRKRQKSAINKISN